MRNSFRLFLFLLPLLCLEACSKGASSGGAVSAATVKASTQTVTTLVIDTQFTTDVTTQTQVHTETQIEEATEVRTFNQTLCTDGSAPDSDEKCPSGASICMNGLISSGTNKGSPCKIVLSNATQMTYFGGLFYTAASPVPSYLNGIAGFQGCPTPGYRAATVLNDTTPSPASIAAPFKLNFCYYNDAFESSTTTTTTTTTTEPTRFVAFGGMYGYGSKIAYINPVTGYQACPFGYNTTQVYGAVATTTSSASSSTAHNAIYMCWKEMDPIDTAPSPVDQAVSFGGMYSTKPGATAEIIDIPNPLAADKTTIPSCPAGYKNQQVLGSKKADGTALDANVFFCYKLITDFFAVPLSN